MVLPTVAYYIVIFLLSPIILLGLVGNCLSVLTWSRGTHRDTSTAVLLTCLAVSDTVVLGLPALEFWTLEVFNVRLRNLNIFMCKLLSFSAFLSPATSSGILVLVTMERVVSMTFPHKVRFICTRLKVGLCVLVIFVFLAAVYSPVVIFVKIHLVDLPSTNGTNVTSLACDVKKDGEFIQGYYRAMMWLDMCSLFMVPFVFIVLGNAVILYKIISSRRVFIKDGHCVSYRTRIANSFTIRAIALSITFLLCTSPITIWELYHSYTWSATDGSFNTLNAVTRVLIHTLLYGNSSINFILYCVIGTGFRNDMKMVLHNACFRKKFRLDRNNESTTAETLQTFFTRIKSGSNGNV